MSNNAQNVIQLPSPLNPSSSPSSTQPTSIDSPDPPVDDHEIDKNFVKSWDMKVSRSKVPSETGSASPSPLRERRVPSISFPKKRASFLRTIVPGGVVNEDEATPTQFESGPAATATAQTANHITEPPSAAAANDDVSIKLSNRAGRPDLSMQQLEHIAGASPIERVIVPVSREGDVPPIGVRMGGSEPNDATGSVRESGWGERVEEVVIEPAETMGKDELDRDWQRMNAANGEREPSIQEDSAASDRLESGHFDKSNAPSDAIRQVLFSKHPSHNRSPLSTTSSSPSNERGYDSDSDRTKISLRNQIVNLGLLVAAMVWWVSGRRMEAGKREKE
ncbi:hypothetical protein BC938DRAFT_477541 [Jimgerdemannia flammicorona]|uniref:Uncharacterized protein n=1 Tax=Jimgerdemannia flammicorona TaxID=994334 RepID=A0A433P955_9FUNG|nr:hypothetical protein BC938DRAFT_477541 [Jimgerdemannia flammicorona]